MEVSTGIDEFERNLQRIGVDPSGEWSAQDVGICVKSPLCHYTFPLLGVGIHVRPTLVVSMMIKRKLDVRRVLGLCAASKELHPSFGARSLCLELHMQSTPLAYFAKRKRYCAGGVESAMCCILRVPS